MVIYRCYRTEIERLSLNDAEFPKEDGHQNHPSDHGNIEDMSTRGHTRNMVPLIAVGPGAEEIKTNASSLVDITPRITRLMVPGYTPPVRNVQPVVWS